MQNGSVRKSLIERIMAGDSTIIQSLNYTSEKLSLGWVAVLILKER
jgi:hypothetical protein